MANPKQDELTPQDIIDLQEQFNDLRNFVEELTGTLFESNDLPGRLRDEIQSLYNSKF